jgi:hypothetical protein
MHAQQEAIKYPSDDKSLYNNSIYDNHISSQRCHKKYPPNIEKFCGDSLFDNFLKISMFMCIMYMLWYILKLIKNKNIDIYMTNNMTDVLSPMRGGNIESILNF